ncbi:hypothetical protein BDV33DRAFT_210656 [Aspergillus novoparasiticus]|uniref:F-box domain-containing protein n=1 Tax=Aspergillus novoparasiticus TaxID=986946 RepID=A0A5N6E977_9EURO|nr:hypothetical protein BDV33DRAFT_210656 [Aspergillus novoparasiticus]
MNVILPCFLCKLQLNASHSRHYVLQEAVQKGIGTGKLLLRDRVDAFNARGNDLQTPVVHCGCWSIAARALQMDCFSQLWIDRFSGYIINMFPFLIQAPFTCPTGDLDANIFVVMLDEGSKAIDRGHFPILLPPEIIQKIYSFLDQEEDIVNLSEVLHYGPSPRQWNELGRKYNLDASADSEFNVRTLVKKILRNPPGRYPRTAHYRTVWNNVRMIATAMERPIDLVPVPRHINVPYAAVLDRSLPNMAKRYAIPTKDVSHLTFTFNGFILSGIIFNGTLVGCPGQIWVSVRVAGLKGLHVAALGGCFVATLIKDMNDWQRRWHGQCPENGTFSRLEWESSRSSLLISHDKGSKVIELACRDERDSHTLFPTQNPVDLSLSLICLYDRHKRNHGLHPLWTFTIDFRQVIAVNTYIEPTWGQFALCALEFVCKDRVHLLGPPTTTGLKLAFPLLPEEFLTALSVGSASDDGHLALTFTTSKNRSVTFGEPCVEISHSLANVAEIAVGKSYLDQHISVLGIFQSPQRQVVRPHRGGLALNGRQYWTSTIDFNISPSMALQSTAPLTGISMIQAFQARKQGPVTGLLLHYRDRYPAVLGELTVESVTQTVEPDEDVRGLTISYPSEGSSCHIYCIKIFVGGRSIYFGRQTPQCFHVQEQRKDANFLVEIFELHK